MPREKTNKNFMKYFSEQPWTGRRCHTTVVLQVWSGAGSGSMTWELVRQASFRALHRCTCINTWGGAQQSGLASRQPPTPPRVISLCAQL